jgi:hypothetical protein
VLTQRAVRVVPDAFDGTGPGPPAFQAWRPFTLAPGAEAYVEMEVVWIGRCMEEGTFVGWHSEPVRFSIVGLPRQTDLDSGVEIRFVGTGGC